MRPAATTRPSQIPTQPPKAVTPHEPTAYDCDVVVIGAGASGLSAAARAAEAGRKVLILEKGKEIGGSAWYAHVFRSLWSKWHEAAGMEDKRDEVYREFILVHRHSVKMA